MFKQVKQRNSKAFWGLAFLPIALFAAGAAAAEALGQPPICSAIEAGSAELQFPFCRVAPLAGKPGQHELTLSLSATTSPVNVGGYRLSETDNYNGGYLPTAVELKPGDTFKVRLVNTLAPRKRTDGMPDGHHDRSTSLHTHGLIVSPKNARPDLSHGGDNIFASLDRGQSLDYSIEIPTKLPATVLDGKKGHTIPHPSGPFWYHAHQHGVSAAQVGGGMSGLLSIGRRDVNLVAIKPAETAALKARTDTAYLMLRDIQIVSATDPSAADGNTPASWIIDADPKLCEPAAGSAGSPPVQMRQGYCQDPKDKTRNWLFTVNGQRFPTIRIPSGRNNLWRVANLSASASYFISLRDSSGKPVKFSVISVDGVLPGVPKDDSSPQGDSPAAIELENLLLMPAARAEILVENDDGNAAERRLVFQTDGIDTSQHGTTAGDRWPEIKLAEVILEGTAAAAAAAAASAGRVGLNQYVASPAAIAAAAVAIETPLPAGCVRDIDRTKLEHRRVTFTGSDSHSFAITTEIVYPTDTSKPQPFDKFEPDDTASLSFVSFEQYLKPEDHTVDWEGTGDGNDTSVRPKHTCVRLGNGHGQLWELSNLTGELHNFHLHQTKFRLATEQDLKEYGIAPLNVELKSGLQSKSTSAPAGKDQNVWHDTLPMAPDQNKPVFIVINFDAEEQVGRYVYHCHILEHEDAGLMAPMEVVR